MNTQGTIPDTFISIIAPVRDLSRSVEKIVLEIDALVRTLFRNFEIVLVDDASRDETVAIIQSLQKKVDNIQLYCLNRRSGLDVAMVAGLDNSIGDFAITLNVECDPVSIIGTLWQKAQQGHDAVCGVRTDRIQGNLHSVLNRIFYRTFEATTGIQVPAGISDSRLYSRRVVSYMSQNNDRHHLLKILPFFASSSVATVEYNPIRREGGFGERGRGTDAFTALTILLASSIRPLRLLTVLSLVASSLSLLFALYVVGVALLKARVVEGWISLALPMAVMFFLISTILGILSEYIYMLSQQSGNRPVYMIIKESTSARLEVQQKLNIVEGTGSFVNRQS